MTLAFYSVFKKNLHILFNSKLSFLILLIGPIFLAFIAGAALQDNSLTNIQVGVYPHEYSESYDSFEGTKFDESDGFYNEFVSGLQADSFIVNREYSLYECRRKVIASEYSACIEVVRSEPPDLFEVDVRGNTYNYELIVHADASRSPRITGEVLARIQKVVDSQVQRAISEKINEARGELQDVISRLEDARGEIQQSIQRLDQLESQINTLESNVQTLDSSLTRAQSEVNSFINDINSLRNYIYSVRTDDYYWDYIISNLNDLQTNAYDLQREISDLDNRYTNTFTYNNFFSSSRQTIQSARSELRSIDEDIEMILSEWNRINKEDLQNLVNPVTFSYQQISSLFSPDDVFLQPEKVSFQDFNENQSSDIYSNLKFFDYFFSSLIMFFIIFASMLLSTVATVRERASNSYVRNVASKRKGLSFVFGDFVSLVVMVFVQVIAISLVSGFFVSFQIYSYLPFVLLYSIPAICLFVLLGIAMGYIFGSQESAVIATISIALLFIIFMPFVTPVESLPPIVSTLVSLAPSVVLESKIRLLTLFGLYPRFGFFDIISFILYGGGVLLVLISFYLSNRRREIKT